MDLQVIVAGGGSFMGRYEVSTGILYNPRAIMIAGTQVPGQTKIALQGLIGNPKEIRVPNPDIVYDVEDMDLLEVYIKSTTGLTLAKDLSSLKRNQG